MLDRRPRRRIQDRARIRRSLSIVPSLFTIGNIFCGYYSIVATLRGNWDYAAILIGIGYILDGLDGRVARLTKTASDFGLQLDSIADVITFGVAPGILAFHWGFGASEGIDGSVAKHVHQLGSLASFAFVVCAALLLARLDLQANQPRETGWNGSLVGPPIAAAAAVDAGVGPFITPRT